MSVKLICSLLVGYLVLLPTAASAEFRGQYELVLNGTNGTASIQSASTHRDGDSIVHELGEHTVTMQPTFSENGAYVLRVSAAPLITTHGAIAISNSQSFSGETRQPLEFKATLGAVSVVGAIVLQRLGE